LQKKYPATPIISEEQYPNSKNVKSKYRFVIDPLDGTINYSRKIDEFGISFALQKENKTIYSLVNMPIKSNSIRPH